jgi:hypothetical protein
MDGEPARSAGEYQLVANTRGSRPWLLTSAPLGLNAGVLPFGKRGFFMRRAERLWWAL